MPSVTFRLGFSLRDGPGDLPFLYKGLCPASVTLEGH